MLPTSETEEFDALVLGAGISGLTSTSVLLRQECRSVLVVDEYPAPGGNHIDCGIGDYTFDVGSYVFQDDSPLLDHFPDLLSLYIPITPTWARLTPSGIVTRYPISIRDDVLLPGPIEWMRILCSLIVSRLFFRSIQNAKDFATYWIGARLMRRSGLEYFLDRFYGVPAEEIDVVFAEKRMLWIREHATLRNFIHRLIVPSEKSRVNRQLARPKQGFEFLYRRATARLERDGATFLLGVKMHRIERRFGKFVVEFDDRRVTAKRLVSTIPLDRIQNLCGLSSEEQLRTVTLITLFYSFSGERGFTDCILYNFSKEGLWKRLTVHSDFYGKSNGREFFSVEINSGPVNGDVSEADRDFRKHVGENGLFSGDLRLEGSHTLLNAYPIYTAHADMRAKQVVAKLRKLGVESLGRQGAFDYQPTARDSTLKAEIALRGGSLKR
jgi:protoporphyrinogen oxidase